nr:NADH dehydrogenase subunit 2 [Eirene ceylonensis]
MTLDLINILIILGVFLIITEFKNTKSNLLYIIFLVGLFSINFFNINIWDTNLFDLSSWKLIFLSLVIISFIVIFDIVEEKTFDVYCLIILVFIGSLILIVSDNLLTLYLGLELQTFSIFILIAKNRTSIKSSEAGLKYFMLGALSSGFYLLSLVILFLYGYGLNIKDLLILNQDFIVLCSITLIILSFCFKLSLFPFHFWIPDIYEGSSWDIITLIATLPKISMICIILQFIINSDIILTFCLCSIVIGTLGALNQSKLKRLLAYSGISHMGFIVLGFNILTNDGSTIGSLYLTIYMLTMISILILIICNNFKNDFIIELSGLQYINKILAITLILLILSTAGIPPLSGFISKWYLIWVAIDHQYNFSSFLMILFSAIGIGYYLRIVKIIYFQKKSSYFLWKNILEVKSSKNEIMSLTLGFLIFISLFLILNFSFIVNAINYMLNYVY